MQKKLTLTCLFLASFIFSLRGQTYKGVWMVNGNLETNTFITNGSPSTGLHLHHQVAVNFSENWMAGAALSIDVVNKVARVGHGLFIRHTALKANKNEFFVHAFFEHSTQRSLQSGGGRFKQVTTFFGPGFGFLHFFNRTIALEAKMDYYLFQKNNQRSYSQKQNGNFLLNVGLQYFFDSKLRSDSTKMDFKINKGDWVIGGIATIGNNNPIENDFYTSNLLQPYAGYFITKNIMVGSGFNYNNDNYFQRFILGLAPLSRYYIKSGLKSQFFGELKFTYNHIWQKNGETYERAPFSYIISPGIGYSTWILPEVSFDIKLNMDKNASYITSSDQWYKSTQYNLNVGLTAFLRK